MQGSLATLDDDAAIAEIANGTLSKQIAARYGVTARAVRKRLASHPEYAQAVKEQAASIVEEATQFVFKPDLSLDEVPIARARVDAAHKWAAARDPATWSGKPDVGAGQVSIQVVNYNVVIAPQSAHGNGAVPSTGVMSSQAIGADATVIDVTPLPNSGK